LSGRENFDGPGRLGHLHGEYRVIDAVGQHGRAGPVLRQRNLESDAKRQHGQGGDEGQQPNGSHVGVHSLQLYADWRSRGPAGEVGQRRALPHTYRSGNWIARGASALGAWPKPSTSVTEGPGTASLGISPLICVTPTTS
jgi:hypothetical protein